MLIGWPLGLVHSYRVLTSNCNGFVSPIDPGIGIAIKWKRSKLNFAEESTFSSRCWCRSGLTAADIGLTNVPFPHSIIHIQLLKRIPGWPCALIRMYKLLPHERGRPPPKKTNKKKNPHILRDEIYFANPSVHSRIRLSLNLNGMDVLDSLKWGMTKSLSDSSRFIGDFFQLIDFREDNNVCG